MRMRWYDDGGASGGRSEAQVMLRHPNYSGLQRDPISLLYIPAHFVDSLEVRQGGELLFSVTGGISISEDPAFRFRYADNGAGVFTVSATDSKGTGFEGAFSPGT
jgi:sulfur-oxidizing protein SoxY